MFLNMDSSCNSMSCATSSKKNIEWNLLSHISGSVGIVYGNAIKIPAEDTESPYYLKGCYVRKRNMRVKRFKMISYTDPPWVYFFPFICSYYYYFSFYRRPALYTSAISYHWTNSAAKVNGYIGRKNVQPLFFPPHFLHFQPNRWKNEHKKSSCSRR